MNEYGELLNESTVRFERLLPGPIERVWRYLTESDKRARWLCGGDVEAAIDGHVDMHFDNTALSAEDDIARGSSDVADKVSFSGKVIRFDPPRLLEHTWEFGDEHSAVCFELEELGDRVRLVLTHRRLDTSDTVFGVSCGWHAHLDLLEDVLEDRPLRPFFRMHERYESEYGQRLGRART